MTRRTDLTDEELIRFLEGQVTQSRAGQIVVLAESSAAERKRIQAMERMLDLVAVPDERLADIDLVDGVRQRIERGEPAAAQERSERGLIALAAICAALILGATPLLFEREDVAAVEPAAPVAPPPSRSIEIEPEAHKRKMERQILSWLSLDEHR